MKVNEIMIAEIEKISPNAKVSEAIFLILKEGIRSLIGTPENSEDVHGIVTARDIVYKVLAKCLNPNEIAVKNIATKPLIFVDADYNVTDAGRIIANLNLARLVVVKSGKIVGIVALIDILRASQLKL